MAYFSYTFASHLTRPPTVTTNTQYPLVTGAYSQVASPFDGPAINLNFYNLGAFANDASIRLGALEALPQYGYSTSKGYVSYTGRVETEGSFYSGIPLVVSPSSSATTIPYTFPVPLAFQVASGNGIVTLANGAVDSTNSKFINVILGRSPDLVTYSTVSALTNYLNGKLIYNSLSQTYGSILYGYPTNSFGIRGTTSPASVGQPTWDATWGSISPTNTKSFWVYINDQKTTNSGVQVTLTQPYLYGAGPSMTTLASIIQVAISNALNLSSVIIPVTTDGSVISLSPSNNRLTTGCYQVRLERSVGDTNSILDWLGWLANSSSNYTETYDYTSLFTFVSSAPTGSPIGISIQGQGSYSTLAFRPQDSTSTITDFLAAFSLNPGLGINYHTRLPLTTYTQRPLNYGGQLTVSSLSVTGTATYNIFSANTLSVSTLNIAGTVHAGQLEGHVVPGYLPNPTFDLDGVSGVLPQQWFMATSITPANPPINTSMTAVLATNPTGVTFLTNNVSPLVGSYDAIWNRPVLTGTGMFGSFIYTKFSIDKANAGQWLQVRFPYLTSASYSYGELAVYFMDSSNVLITPSLPFIPYSTSPTQASYFTTYFKATSNLSNYWMVIYEVGTGLTAMTFEIGAVSVSDTFTVAPLIRADFYNSLGGYPANGQPINFDSQQDLVGGPVLTATVNPLIVIGSLWKFQPPLPGVYSVTFSANSPNVLTAMTVGTNAFGFDLYKSGSPYTRLVGKYPDATSAAIGSVSGSATVRVVNPIVDYLNVVYNQAGTFTGTLAFLTTSGVQPRITIQWLGF